MAVKGRLDCFALGDVLQVLGLRRASGVVRITGDRARGEICLDAGVPISAGTEEGACGEAAFFILLQNSSGEFVFHSRNDQAADAAEAPDHAATSRNAAGAITRGLDSLLLQVAEMQVSAPTSGSLKALCYDDSGL